MSTARSILLSCCFVVAFNSLVIGESLKGRVYQEDGKPGGGARVWAVNLKGSRRIERIESKADEDGRFELKLSPAQWLVQATLGNQGTTGNQFLVPESTPAKRLELRMVTCGLLKLRVLQAESGRPLAGAKFVLDNGLEPVTDQDGRLEVPALYRSRYHEAFVIAPGRERKRILFEMSEKPVTHLEVQVSLGGKAVGQVLDEAGKPIPHAGVGKPTSGSMLTVRSLWVEADERGRFEYDGLVLNRTTWLSAKADGFNSGGNKYFHVDFSNESVRLDFRLSPSPRAASIPAKPVTAKAVTNRERRDVSGIVLDSNQRPVIGATLRWGVLETSESIETKTDAAGKFRLSLVTNVPDRVCVMPIGNVLAPQIVDVKARGDQELTIKLATGHVMTGVVKDDRGTPFVGVSVIPSIDSPGTQGLFLFYRGTKTDANGRFTLKGLPDKGTKFYFGRDGVSVLRDELLEAVKENVIIMTSAGAVRGHVVDHQGKPVRSFRVLLNAPRERMPDDKFGGFFAGFCGIGLSYTSDDGSFLITNLGANSVQRITIIAPGHGEGTIDRVVADPLNHWTPDHVLTFRLPKSNHLKVQTVDDTTGQFVTNAQVGLILDDPNIEQSFTWGYHDSAWGDTAFEHTDATGVATFSPLSFQEATLLVRAKGFGRVHQGWRDGRTKIDVKLKPECVIEGELRDLNTGKPLAGVYARLIGKNLGQTSLSIESGDLGRFRFDELPEDDYTLSVTNDQGSELHSENFKLKAGESVTRLLKVSEASAAVQRAMQNLLARKAKPALATLKVGAIAPALNAKTLDDKPVSLKELEGKYVLLDFWATWCGPCLQEIPKLQAVHEAFGNDPKFVMISLSMDSSRDDVRKFLKSNKQPWSQVFLGSAPNEAVAKAYGIEMIPSIVLIDPEGKIVATNLRGDAIKSTVAKALGKK
jgi:thiol-disulfide isomerase/thioredoxin